MNKDNSKYKCDICNKKYSCYTSFWYHNKKFHKLEPSNITINKLECEFCKKIFSRPDNCKNHKKICKIKEKYEEENLNSQEFKQKNDLITLKNDISELKYIINSLQNIKTNNKFKIDFNLKQIPIINTEIQKNSKINNNIELTKNVPIDFINNIIIFNNKSIIFFYYNNQVYMKANDIIKILDFEIKIIDNIDIKDKLKINNIDNNSFLLISNNSIIKNENPQTIFINESGFYSLILSSNKEEIIQFKYYITSEVFPSIRKYGTYNITNNYIDEDLDDYYKKDCVYIINIKDNIYKYGSSSHIFKRLQTHKKNLNYKKI
jgi:prophage antirepressor-like protein